MNYNVFSGTLNRTQSIQESVMDEERTRFSDCHQEVHAVTRNFCHSHPSGEQLVTLSDPQGHLPAAGLFKCDFWYSCTAVDKILTDKNIARVL